MSQPSTILFVGGGSGGHIFPNLAVAERLLGGAAPHFLVSDRAIDATIMEPTGYAWTAAPAKPFYRKPGPVFAFLKGYLTTRLLTKKLIREHNIRAVVATGGFVTTPAVVAANKLGLPVALVNLDAVPGKANRAAARYASTIFSVYDTPQFPKAQRIGLPLRTTALATLTPQAARQAFGLDPDRPTILVFAGSQGGSSINQTMVAWAEQKTRNPLGETRNPKLETRSKSSGSVVASRSASDSSFEFRVSSFQLLHFTGPSDAAQVAAAYAAAGIAHHVAPFCDRMGLAWAAADLAVCRAGAGSVAEAWANAVPAIFLPYPYHKDQHQRLNAQPLVDAGGAMVLDDHVDSAKNLANLGPHLASLLDEPDRLAAMREALRTTRPDDGARVLADWLGLVTGHAIA